MPRAIVHLDADAFFASVEQAADPRLRGKPVAVGGEKRGIIASASYEARKFGIYTPMPTARAHKLCPRLIVLPPDFDRYEHFSRWMFSYAYDFTPDVEQTSIDEGYFDLTGAGQAPAEIALAIRKAIGQSLKISVSEGIGVNKLVSQIASKLTKPAAFFQVPPGREISFLHPLPNQWLPGVGPKAAVRLNAAGLARIGQIAATPLDLLHVLMGNIARSLRDFANGIDDRPLLPAREPQKSFSQQETFPGDLTDQEYLQATLRRMADHLFAKVRQEGRSIRTLTVKVRYNDMAEDQTSESLREPTDLETDVYGRLHNMLRAAWKRRVSLRLVSLKLSNVYDGRFRGELALDVPAQRQEARERLALAIDDLRRARGHSVILRGHDFRLREAPREAVAAAPTPAPETRPTVHKPSPPREAAGAYIPLRVHSHYSFLDSTLSPAAIVELAKCHGLPAVALTDTGNLHGAVEFTLSAKQAGVKPVLGVEISLDQKPLLLYVESTPGYRNLNRLLSRHAEATAARGDEASVAGRQRGSYHRRELDGLTEGLIAVSADAPLAELFPGRFYGLVTGGQNASPAVACPAVRYAIPQDRQKYDILQSIRTLTLLRQPHPEKHRGGRFHFRAPAEMAAACQEHPDWLRHAREIAERCHFELPFGLPQFPAFTPPDGSPPHEFLRRLVLQSLPERYGARAPRFQRQVLEELSIIQEVSYEEYFLITWDFLQDCRRRGLDWITRGSAADSLVCYCLGISGVCPIRFDLYFRRFLNKDRMALHKLPDIDIDFAHDRKDDVVNLIFQKYGREHCAVVGGFSTFQARSAFAEVAKVLGMAERQVCNFTDHFPWSFGGGWVPAQHTPSGGARLIEILRASPENRDLPLDEEPCRTALQMAEFLDGVPRHPKMHPCGLVLSRQPILELTPTFLSNKGCPATHFDMDAVEAVGLVKMDILAQGGLAVMRDVKVMLAARGIAVDLEHCLARDKADGRLLLGNPQAPEPWQDPQVWEMIADGGARAVHHIESPAMTSLCRMCDVREIDGLIAIVSVIRPGAANEGKKLAFTRRYQGLEPVTYPHPSLEPCLRSTFGLVVYEEHILQLCEAFAGLNPGWADVLRRALNKQNHPVIEKIRGEFFQSALARGHSPEKTAEVWALVAGFAGYAFCKAHSAAYGVEAYQSAWLKRHFPVEFMAAVLSNGKGFYHPIVYVLECHRLGIQLLPPSINQPGPLFQPAGRSIRVPVRAVKGLTARTGERILAERGRRPFSSLADFHRRVAAAPDEMESLLRVGAFDEFGRTCAAQFWECQFLQRAFAAADASRQGLLLPPPGLDRLPEVPLAEPTRRERLESENELLGFPASGHPLELHDHIAWHTYCPVSRLGGHVGEEVVTCGLVVEQRTHHQITGEPMKFLTLADWTGMVETELFAQTHRSYGLATVRYPVLEITAKVEPYENGRGYSLRVLRAGKPRSGLT
ncbi:MAG: DNA polymerase IV [Verrucomicrobiota bacterium]|jgi:error-prone DNA polymerase